MNLFEELREKERQKRDSHDKIVAEINEKKNKFHKKNYEAIKEYLVQNGFEFTDCIGTKSFIFSINNHNFLIQASKEIDLLGYLSRHNLNYLTIPIPIPKVEIKIIDGPDLKIKLMKLLGLE